MTEQVSWISLAEAAPHFGLSLSGIRNAITEERFCCPTYKLNGKKRVIDRAVMKAFFDKQRAEGLAVLANTTN